MALLARTAEEWDGAAVRRFTRRATAARADTRWWTRLGDLASGLTSAAIAVAVCGGLVSGLREQIAARPPVSAAVLPGGLTATAVAVAVAAGLVALFARLGPVSATPGVAAWWLPLPAGRRELLRGELRRGLGLAAAAAVGVALPVVLTGTRTLGGVLTGLVAGGLLAVAAVGALVVRQAGSGTRWVPAAAGGVVAAALVAPPVLGCLAVTAGARVAWPAVPALPWGAAAALLLVLGAGAAWAVVLADRRLGELSAAALRASGETVQYATASVFSLDTREIGRALRSPVRRPRRALRWRWVRRAEHAVVAGDLAVLARSPWRWGQLAGGAALPVLAARTQGLGELPALVAVAVVLGWWTAATAVGEPSRRASSAPGADRSLPLAAAVVVRCRAVVPVAVLAVVLGVSALLVGQGAGSPVAWLALGVAAAPAWAGAAVRAGYRPDLDWAGPVVSSPMGAVPTGVGATLVRGPDVGVLGIVPVVLALLLGAVPWWLVAGGLAWSLALAAFAVATAHQD
ncbi:hypothetical protein GCU67_06730 [Modestobacter muralis]|uniref:Uncharacterized protein n=1 Tax=Modestobacter muralis TaxID=1608614 RepID=A0A6P0ESP2_9ACTN|nr:DUF6297 family protein [Modestobacter muralis]NEK93870.1 hypothetical protein [Modestobacter muralis]NEN50637.1 hypothetical protein [Modestobacter muralis]